MYYSSTIRFSVSKELLKKLQQKSKAKTIDDYINQLVMRDIDKLTYNDGVRANHPLHNDLLNSNNTGLHHF